MKVYLVYADNGGEYPDGYERWVDGVFDSREKAVAFIESNPDMIQISYDVWIEYEKGYEHYELQLAINNILGDENDIDSRCSAWIEEWEVE